MLEKIEKVIKEVVRPYLGSHGGDIKVVGMQDGILKVELLGNCSGCPSARYTIADVVKGVLIERFPEIKDVELESKISQDMIDLAKEILSKDKYGGTH